MDETKRGSVRTIHELGRKYEDYCWASSVHGLRKEKEPENRERKKEMKEGK